VVGHSEGDGFGDKRATTLGGIEGRRLTRLVSYGWEDVEGPARIVCFSSRRSDLLLCGLKQVHLDPDPGEGAISIRFLLSSDCLISGHSPFGPACMTHLRHNGLVTAWIVPGV